MTKEEFEFLTRFEKNYNTALNSNYTTAIWSNDLNTMLSIYKKYKGNYTLCTHCTSSILAFVKKVGAMYFEEKNKLVKEETDNAKANEGEGNSKRQKSNKRKKD